MDLEQQGKGRDAIGRYSTYNAGNLQRIYRESTGRLRRERRGRMYMHVWLCGCVAHRLICGLLAVQNRILRNLKCNRPALKRQFETHFRIKLSERLFEGSTQQDENTGPDRSNSSSSKHKLHFMKVSNVPRNF